MSKSGRPNYRARASIAATNRRASTKSMRTESKSNTIIYLERKLRDSEACIGKLETENKRLNKALRKYGNHGLRCPAYGYKKGVARCVCGYERSYVDEAIKETL